MQAYFEKNKDAILKDWFEYLRMPSIGADVKHLGDCVKTATWLKQFLKPLGFDVELILPETTLPVPVVVAERPGAPGASTVLFYGHYDVQPVDPVAEWKTPPFEPTLIDGRVYCRGADDDKGQAFAWLQGMKARILAGDALPTIKIVLEGQEESGSTGLCALAPQLKARLKADVMLVCDTACGRKDRPAIIAGLRGVQSLQVRLDGPAYDLHSGVHGGVAPNPVQGMAALMASLHEASGRVAVAGFYDHVCAPTDAERAAALEDAPSAEAYEAEIGCPPEGGEAGLPAVERSSFQPTIELNGLHAGYGGPGSKTVIPTHAIAKLSMRLVPDQHPEHTLAAVKTHLAEHCPRGLRLTVSEEVLGAPGFRLPMASPLFRLAADVLTEMDARGPVFHWEGASIPVVAILQHVTGAAPLLVGFGREEDKIHCPNESFGLDQFVRAMTWSHAILAALR